ncbi:hypothetical protein BASA60_009727 [Batrachochytrium salamandrivorans]|nr:hypothetical protein BASA60_009727 [Batrachochytrium salamandrivorans]
MPYVDLKSNGEHPRASTRSLGAKQDGRTSDGDGFVVGIKKQQNVLERIMAAAAAKGKTQSDVLVNVSSHLSVVRPSLMALMMMMARRNYLRPLLSIQYGCSRQAIAWKAVYSGTFPSTAKTE